MRYSKYTGYQDSNDPKDVHYKLKTSRTGNVNFKVSAGHEQRANQPGSGPGSQPIRG
jgi:hypothetical protein